MKNEPKQIIFFEQNVIVNCDRNCKKAWGITQRKKLLLSDDPDDYLFLPDGELGIAPDNPGTYEGSDGKPKSPKQFPNKWCVRECERCVMRKPGEDINLHDWNYPLFNFPRKL